MVQTCLYFDLLIISNKLYEVRWNTKFGCNVIFTHFKFRLNSLRRLGKIKPRSGACYPSQFPFVSYRPRISPTERPSTCCRQHTCSPMSHDRCSSVCKSTPPGRAQNAILVVYFSACVLRCSSALKRYVTWTITLIWLNLVRNVKPTGRLRITTTFLLMSLS